MTAEALDTFVADVTSLVDRIDDEHEITSQVATRLSAPLASGYRLPPELARPSSERHVDYPLHIAPDGSWSLARHCPNGSTGWKRHSRTRDTIETLVRATRQLA